MRERACLQPQRSRVLARGPLPEAQATPGEAHGSGTRAPKAVIKKGIRSNERTETSSVHRDSGAAGFVVGALSSFIRKVWCACEAAARGAFTSSVEVRNSFVETRTAFA